MECAHAYIQLSYSLKSIPSPHNMPFQQGWMEIPFSDADAEPEVCASHTHFVGLPSEAAMQNPRAVFPV